MFLSLTWNEHIESSVTHAILVLTSICSHTNDKIGNTSFSIDAILKHCGELLHVQLALFVSRKMSILTHFVQGRHQSPTLRPRPYKLWRALLKKSSDNQCRRKGF